MSPDVISSITKVTEGNPNVCLNETIMIQMGDVIDVLPDASTGNNILTVHVWVNKVEKCNNGSNKISVKLDVYGLVYHNITLKDVTKAEVLNRMYTERRKREMF